MARVLWRVWLQTTTQAITRKIRRGVTMAAGHHTQDASLATRLQVGADKSIVCRAASVAADVVQL